MQPNDIDSLCWHYLVFECDSKMRWKVVVFIQNDRANPVSKIWRWALMFSKGQFFQFQVHYWTNSHSPIFLVAEIRTLCQLLLVARILETQPKKYDQLEGLHNKLWKVRLTQVMSRDKLRVSVPLNLLISII